MKLSVLRTKVAKLLQQRNVLFPTCIGLTICVMLLSIMLMYKKERIILVPAAYDKPFWVEGATVSPSYLEQMGLLLSGLMLTKSLQTSQAQMNLSLRHVHPSYVGAFRQFFLEEERTMKDEQLSFVFYPKEASVQMQDHTVFVQGERALYIGRREVEREPSMYKFRFTVMNGRCFLIDLQVEEKKKIEGRDS